MLAALLRRDVDGQGQVVDTAMFEAVLRMTGDALAVRSALGIRRERAGETARSTRAASPSRPRTAASSPCRRRAGPTSAPRSSAWAVRDPTIPSAAAGRWRRSRAALPAEDVTRALRRAGLGASPVNSVADLVGEAHLWSRGDLVRRADPELGEVVMQGVVPLLSETPGRITGWSPAPGSDNDAVLGEWLGYAPDQIRRVDGGCARRSAVRGRPQPTGQRATPRGG